MNETTRLQLNLDGRWQFWTDPEGCFSPGSLPAEQAISVAVPAPWQSQSPDLRFYTGAAWYGRQLDIPADWFGDRIIMLGFGAADHLAEVWLNEVKLGEHEGGYLPFDFDVTGVARPGPNYLAVRISDPLERFPEIPHGKQSWYGLLSGLWQSVWLESRPSTHLVRFRLTPQGQQLEVVATLNRPLAAGHTLRYEVFGPDNQLCAQTSTNALSLSIPVPSPSLWDIDTPNLYRLLVTLNDPTAAPLDSLSDTFGFRTIETADGRLLLNGRPLYLRGALDQDYYPDLICTPPSAAYIEDQFRQAKAMGLNCLRLHIKITDPRYYAAADRLGLLIWADLPNWQTLTAATQEIAHDTLLGMVERDWNHPSIIIWTIINESWGVDLTNPEHRAWLAGMVATLKRLDPHRLIVGNSACEGNYHVAGDLIDFHNYYAMPDHYDRWRSWVQKFASRPAWTVAHEYKNFAAWRAFSRRPWQQRERLVAAEVRCQGNEPLLVSEFGNWGLPDVAQLRQAYGGEPWWFETGLDWGDGVVYPHGVEARFRQFHLDQIFPTLSALSAASQRLQFAALKYEIEQIRRQQAITGYVITEFTDVHWESNGLLNMVRQPKLFFEQLATINNDDLIIPDWHRLAYWEGERCEVALFLSHYSAADLQGSRLEWRLDGFANCSGVFVDLTPLPAAVTAIGKVVFAAPAVERGTKASLSCRLFNRTGRLVSHNELELTFFPRRASAAAIGAVYAPTLAGPLQTRGYTLAHSLDTADVALVETMTDDLRLYLQQGGRILWLAESAAALQTHLGGLRIKRRKGSSWQGDWASTFCWLRQDAMFGDIPTQNMVDFTFAGLTPEYVITGLRPHDFATDVHAGLFAGWLHQTVALIASRVIGRGHLLITTFRLAKQVAHHPVAALMVQDMLAHLAEITHPSGR
jgi:hypothetical protein